MRCDPVLPPPPPVGFAPGFIDSVADMGVIVMVPDARLGEDPIDDPVDGEEVINAYCAAPVASSRHGAVGLVLGVSGMPTRFRDGAEQVLSFARTSILSELDARADRESMTRRMDLEKLSARVDTLTGLPNMRSFESSCQVEQARAQRHDHQTAIAVVELHVPDADEDTQEDDTQGSDAGDALVSRAGDAMAEAIRTSDLAFRIGDGRFAVLAPRCGPPFVPVLADRLRRAMAGRDIPASVGAASQTTPDVPLGDVLDMAQDLMLEEQRQ